MKISEKPTWQDSKKSKSAKGKYPTLKEHIKVDVAIVGGGITGITSAYLLSKAGLKVAVLEAKEDIAADTTMYTTAFITKVIDTSITDLNKMFGAKNARMVWDSGQAAIDLIADIVRKEKIDCEFKRVDYYEYANNPDQFDELEEEQKTSRKLGFLTSVKNGPINFGFKNFGAWQIKNQAKFDPIKYVEALADRAREKGAIIFTNTEVTKIKGKGPLTLETKSARLSADYAIIATYKPFENSLRTFGKKGMYQSYVFEVRLPKGTIKEGLYIDLENPYHYLRLDSYPSHDRLIIGGEDHREEIKMNQGKNFQALEEYLKTIIPGVSYKIIKRWTGPILEPSDGIALIGEVKNHQLIGSAFSGNGMTYSTIAAMVFRDIILKKKNPWIALYNPKRKLKIKRLVRKARDYSEELYHGAIKNSIQQKGEK